MGMPVGSWPRPGMPPGHSPSWMASAMDPSARGRATNNAPASVGALVAASTAAVPRRHMEPVCISLAAAPAPLALCHELLLSLLLRGGQATLKRCSDWQMWALEWGQEALQAFFFVFEQEFAAASCRAC